CIISLYLHSFPTRRSSDLPNPSNYLSSSKKDQLDQARAIIPADPGINVVEISPGHNVVRGRILIADFDINSSDLKPSMIAALDEDRKSTRLNSSHLGISYA